MLITINSTGRIIKFELDYLNKVEDSFEECDKCYISIQYPHELLVIYNNGLKNLLSGVGCSLTKEEVEKEIANQVYNKALENLIS